MSAIGLTPQAARGLDAAAVLLRETQGFMFLPLLVESERAASAALAYLQAPLPQQFYKVALPTNDQPNAVLANLDDAIGKLPPSSVVVLDASSSVHHAMALQAVAYLNLRREPLRTAQLRFLLCWSIQLKDELLAKAADLWSMRSASPFILEADLVFFDPTQNRTTYADPLDAHTTKPKQLTIANQDNLARWEQHHTLQAADLSTGDAFALAHNLYAARQWSKSAEIAEAFVQAVKQSQPSTDQDTVLLAITLVLLSLNRHRLGNISAALENARESELVMRTLAKAAPGSFEPTLAMSIHNLANRLYETGDRAGALTAAREAVDIYRRLAQEVPASFESDFASSVSNLATYLSDTDDHAGALLAAREAVNIYTRLAQASPTRFESDFAGSINNLANCLSVTGDHAAALAAAREALEIRRRLAQAAPASFEPDLALSLGTLMLCLNRSGRIHEAQEAGNEALQLFEKLNVQNAGVFDSQVELTRNILQSIAVK